MEQGERQASQRLDLQIRFILEMDKLKTIIRRTYLLNADRAENTAEHSWHLAIMAMLLAEHANEPVNVSRVVKMVLIHDVVEIDAGDTYFYDTAAAADKADRERTAADRLFGMLPRTRPLNSGNCGKNLRGAGPRKLDSRGLSTVSCPSCTIIIPRADPGTNTASPSIASSNGMNALRTVRLVFGSAPGRCWMTLYPKGFLKNPGETDHIVLFSPP